MKIFLILLFFFCGLWVRANDTLTRAQVYNFNIGDTFDYKIAYFSVDYNADNFTTADTGYLRKVIEGKYLSSDSNTLFIVEHLHYKYIVRGDSVVQFSDFNDTLRVDSILKFVISDLDTSSLAGYSFYYYADTSFHGRIINGYQLGIPLGGLHYMYYADGLGRTSAGWGYMDGCCSNQQYDTTLIYYAKGAEIWGSPYYNLTTSIDQPGSDIENITLYPTLNSGTFNVKITGIRSAACQLVVNDITGREIKRVALNNSNNNITIPNLNEGMYLWSVTGPGIVLQSGKMLVN